MKLTELNKTKTTKNHFYHSSKDELKIGKIYTAKKSRGTFGDFEKIFDKYKPTNEVSRRKAFYVAPSKNVALRFGTNVYRVEPAGKCSTGALGWVGILIDYLDSEVVGYDKKSGYKLSKISMKKLPIVKEIIKHYYTGKVPTVSNVKKLGLNKDVIFKDAEFNIIEFLCTKIKVIA